jgi:hypothetical protein
MQASKATLYGRVSVDVPVLGSPVLSVEKVTFAAFGEPVATFVAEFAALT